MRRSWNRRSQRKLCHDSDSETEDDEVDVLKLKLELKKGDSVVQKLLDMWTSAGDVKGQML